ncbi:hypothetical protein LWI29_032800 [Acer saccharum]|uniref:Uncharacterized protein n=1 Tax=Acer saccharum TaxID=4024 RepID=A0AA39SZT9_ACESA|nr:hypothetical protein LWI29_032800 [Acer saccharum]
MLKLNERLLKFQSISKKSLIAWELFLLHILLHKHKSLFDVLDHLMLWALEKNETVQLFETKMMEDLVMVEPVSGTAQSALV